MGLTSSTTADYDDVDENKRINICDEYSSSSSVSVYDDDYDDDEESVVTDEEDEEKGKDDDESSVNDTNDDHQSSSSPPTTTTNGDKIPLPTTPPSTDGTDDNNAITITNDKQTPNGELSKPSITNGDSSPTSLSPPEAPFVQTISDLLNLTYPEITNRLDNATLSISSLRSADAIVIKSTSLVPSSENCYSWYHDDTTTTTATTVSDEVDGTTTITTTPQKSPMEVVLFLLNQSPALKALRFKMVPAKIKEARFWNAVFYLLLTEEERMVVRGDDVMEGEEDIKVKDAQCSSGRGVSDVAKDAIIRQKDVIIRQLKERITHLERQLTSQTSSTPTTDKSTPPTPSPSHDGSWILSKECLEFHSLDDDLKKTLREQKQKRLRDVEEQMKFILDSDDVRMARGRWDCCGETVYHRACSC